MAGEAGLLMCTFPQADWNYEKACGQGPEWATGYFNECMNGFEHQAAEGWGTFSQKATGGRMQAEIDLKQGRLRLKIFALTPPAGMAVTTARITQDGKDVQARLVQIHDRVMLAFTDDVSLAAGQYLAVELT